MSYSKQHTFISNTTPNNMTLKKINSILAKRNKSTTIPEYLWLYQVGLVPVPEYKFYNNRRWRIDYAFPDQKLAIEIEGGVYTRGRHVRPTGFIGDIEKYNALTECGWRLLRYQPNRVDFEQVKRCLQWR